jgi:hypothetical protein
MDLLLIRNDAGEMTGAGVPAFQSNVRDKAARQAWLFVPSCHCWNDRMHAGGT